MPIKSKMSSSINKNVNVERRTWDKDAYEARARSRAAAAEASSSAPAPAAGAAAAAVGDADDDAAAVRVGIAAAIRAGIDPTEEKEEFLPAKQGRAGPMGSERAFLKSRARKVDLEGKLGSTEIIDPAAASATRSRSDDAIGSAPPLTPASGVSKMKDGVGWVSVRLHAAVDSGGRCYIFLHILTNSLLSSFSSTVGCAIVS